MDRFPAYMDNSTI